MRISIGKLLVTGLVFGAVTFVPGVIVSASELDTEVPVAGISVVLNDYMDASEDAETEIAELLPEKVEKAQPARHEIFNNMAIAFVDDYVNVRKKPSTESKIVGKIFNNCSATIISEKDGWYEIKSGNVKGYIASEFFLTGADAEEYAIENGYVLAQVSDALHVRARATTKARVVTSVYENETYAVRDMSDTGDWTKLAIAEDLRGWVSSDYIDLSVNMDTALTLKEEEEKIEAEQRAIEEAASIAAEEAAAQEAAAQEVYQEPEVEEQVNDNSYTDNSNDTYQEPVVTEAPTEAPTQAPAVTEAPTQAPTEAPTEAPVETPGYNATTGAEVVAYAMQFLGNPYVYGGSSLTNGTDCSGFTMSVYAHFGYYISRSSYTQAYDGVAVSIDQVQPGDLLFYTNGNTRIEHVAMYIGNGQIIHASTPQTGIKISSMYGNGLCCARRIITN